MNYHEKIAIPWRYVPEEQDIVTVLFETDMETSLSSKKVVIPFAASHRYIAFASADFLPSIITAAVVYVYSRGAPAFPMLKASNFTFIILLFCSFKQSEISHFP